MQTTYIVISAVLIIAFSIIGYFIYKNYVKKISNVETFTENIEIDASEYYNPNEEILLVFCKMESCGHCKTFNNAAWKPVESQVNNTTLKSGKKLKMMVADMNHPLTADVTGFPTIKCFKENPMKYNEYNGERLEKPFKDYCLNL